MKTTTLRLRRVRFKDGRTLEVLRPRVDHRSRDGLAAAAGRAVEGPIGDDMAGWALVAWSRDGRLFVSYDGEGTLLPSGGIPGFVHDALLAECAVQWTHE